jgi:hypothetical protein
MVFQNDILAGASGTAAGYTIDQSIRFPSPTTGYLNRTPSSASDRRTWTWSGWIKRSTLAPLAGSADAVIFGADASSSNFLHLRIDGASTNADELYLVASSSTMSIRYAPLLRDVSAWYHIVVRIDTTDATAADRAKVYLNGIQITDIVSATYPSLNREFAVNNTVEHDLGRLSYAGTETFEGYMAEINFIDGQALGVWIPKKYAGTYGTNGFYITGANSAALGEDFSGNGNDWTSTGLTSDDQVSDSPADTYAVYNNIIKGENSYHASGYGWGSNTISEGGLKVLGPTGTNLAGATISYPSSGKFYYEATYIGTDTAFFGIADLYDDTKAVWYRNNGWVSENSSSWNTSSGAASYSAGDVLAIAVNMDGNEAKFYKNNSLQSTVSLTAGSTYTPVLFGGNSSIGFSIDFGQLGFTYTPPTGFVALSTANLPAPTIKDGSAYFQTTLYTGNGTTNEINQIGNSTFQPDMVWAKSRSAAQSHRLADAIRGSAVLFPDLTNAEDTTAGISFDADGFSWTNSDGSNANDNTVTYAAWQWLAANGTASNTNGSITSTVSANTTDGFSIVSYTGNATSGATIGHGLSQAPEVVITKSRDNGTGRNWAVFHADLGPTKYLELDNNNQANTSSTRWNDTSPSSTVVTLGSQQTTNDNGAAMIAYCWHSVEGFSKFGTYTGNGSADGPFVQCNFRPAFVIVKEYTSADDWVMYDSTRDPYNVAGRVLRCDTSAAEFDGRGGSRDVDFLSNGFKFRSSNATMNGSGAGYIFMAFAEHPFGGNGVAPVPAR